MWNQEILLLQHFCKNTQNKAKLQSSNILGVKENKPLRKQGLENWQLSSGGKFITTLYGRSLRGFSRRLLDVQHMWNSVLGIVVRGQEGKVGPHYWSGPESLSLPPGGILHSCPANPERALCRWLPVQTDRGATSGFSRCWSCLGASTECPPRPPRSSSLGTSDMGFYDHKL